MPPTPVPSAGSSPRLVRDFVVEGMMRGMGIELASEEGQSLVRALGGTRTLPADVPAERYAEVVRLVARRHHPQLSEARGLHEVGKAVFEGYRKTLMGKLALSALSLMGPERLVKKIPEILRRNTNFGERHVEQRGPNHYVIVSRGVPLPGDYYAGVLDAAMHAVGVEPQLLRWEQTAPEDTLHEVRW